MTRPTIPGTPLPEWTDREAMDRINQAHVHRWPWGQMTEAEKASLGNALNNARAEGFKEARLFWEGYRAAMEEQP